MHTIPSSPGATHTMPPGTGATPKAPRAHRPGTHRVLTQGQDHQPCTQMPPLPAQGPPPLFGRMDRRWTPRHTRLQVRSSVPYLLQSHPPPGNLTCHCFMAALLLMQKPGSAPVPRQGDNRRCSPGLKCCLRLALSCLFFWAGTGIRRSLLLCQKKPATSGS